MDKRVSGPSLELRLKGRLATAQAQLAVLRDAAAGVLFCWNNLSIPGDEGDESLMRMAKAITASTETVSTYIREIESRTLIAAIQLCDDGDGAQCCCRKNIKRAVLAKAKETHG